MRPCSLFLGLALTAALGACGGAGSSGGPSGGGSSGGGGKAGLSAQGELTFSLRTALPGGETEGRLSAPLFPDITAIQHLVGDGYPATDAARRDVVDRHVLTFADLLAECPARYPLIKIPMPGDTLTPEELATNFNQVARCSYEQHGAKPYWIPQLIDDVDLCAQKLGAGWRLPTEADLRAFSDADLLGLRETLTGVSKLDSLNGSAASWGVVYFSLKIYARAADGALIFGDLNPDAAARTRALGVAPERRKQLLIDAAFNNAVLRCLRAG